MSTLSVTSVAGAGDRMRSLVMLHGIYGRGRNWQAVARGLVARRPEYTCWLVDLPHHGNSGAGAHGETVHGLAADVADWLSAHSMTPDAILGHSYGGKVALAMAQRADSQAIQVWVIDSTPEARPPSGSAWNMLAVVGDRPGPFTSREEAVEAVVKAGFTLGVAQWMATNVVRDGDHFRWRIDRDIMERLLRDFFATDLWAVVEHPAPGHDIHFLKASESSAISAEAVARIERASGARVHLHLRQGGHWIHAESPEVVTELLLEHLP